MKKKKISASPPMADDLVVARRRVLWRSFRTIRSFAIALIQLVHYRDADGRDIGFDYEYIRDAVLRRFPKVTCNGPHKGNLTKMPYKELQEFACDLNRQGIRLPFRPFRPRHKIIKKAIPIANLKAKSSGQIRPNRKGKSVKAKVQPKRKGKGKSASV